MSYKLNQKQYYLLLEAMRRYQTFYADARPYYHKWTLNDMILRNCWTGMGYKTAYKPLTDDGFMSFYSEYKPRCMGWLHLTKKGAKIILNWHRKGYNWYNQLPPWEVEI